MNNLFYFVLFCLTLATIKIPPLVIPIIFILIVLFKKTPLEVTRNGIFIVIIALFISICAYFLSFSKKIYVNIGVVIDKRNNYVIVWTLSKKLYVPLKNNELNIGDIITLNGTFAPHQFQTYEEGFNFKSYLSSKGVEETYILENVKYIIKNPLGFIQVQNVNLTPYSEDSAILLRAFFLNDKDYKSTFFKTFASLEVIYLLSFSGIHFSSFIRFNKKIFNYFFSSKTVNIITIFIIALFLLNYPSRFTIWRLFLINIIVLVNSKKKQLTYLECVLLSGFIFLILNPYLIYQMSFYLSYSLIIVLNLSYDLLNRRKSVGRFLLSSLIVYFFLLPIRITNNSFTLSLFSYVYMIIFTPLLSVFFILGFFSLTLLPLPKTLNFLTNIIRKISDFFMLFNYRIPIGKLPPVFILLFYFLFIFLLYSVEVKHKPLKQIVNLSYLVMLLLQLLPLNNLITEEVYFINVGQGDATLIRKGNTSVLIDTGGLKYYDLANDTLIPFFNRKKIKRLDAVIVTHNDYDHSGSLSELENNFKIKQIIRTHDYFPLKINSLEINSLSNPHDFSDENEKSLVLYTRLCNLNFLFMGDATKNNEEYILNKYPNLKVDVLKLGHHGSSTSSSEKFLRYYKPKVAIISCGYKNKYNHPAIEVINRLNKLNIKIRRTDLDPAIYYKSLII